MAAVADADKWPEKPELERWLMTTVKDADPGVAFLRQVLQMNPAYGSYLSDDKDMAAIVQMFAKRVRARCVASQGAVQPHMLYEPLCEMGWRIIGSVLHSILDLQQDENYPIPKEPLGQVKMLMQTNMELSRKLNNMRRDYLRELSVYRDEKRTISEEAQKTLSGLQEQPIMFFEPLKFVLDETTKDFVRAVVEERVKLEQKTPMLRKEEPKDERPEDNSALNHEISELQAELRRLKEALQSEKDAKQKLQLLEKQLRQEIEDLKKSLQGRQGVRKGASDDDELQALRDELAKAKALIAELQGAMNGSGDEKMAALQKQMNKLQQELADAKQKLAQLEKEKQDLLDELARLKDKIGDDTEVLVKKGGKTKGDTEIKKKVVKETVVDDDELESLRKQLKKSLAVEKELRDANRELERALEELRKQRSLTTNNGDDMASKIPKGDAGKAARAALEAAQAEFAKKTKAMQDEIDRLRALLEELQNADPNVKVKQVHSGVSQSQYDAVVAERDELKKKVDDLMQQVAILLEKLRKYGGDAAVKEVEALITLTPAAHIKKAKGENVFERLYKDAQRRMQTAKDLVARADQEQKDMLAFYMKKAMNPTSAKILENLKHLQRAAAATQNRFMDAAARFEEGHLDQFFNLDKADGAGIFARRVSPRDIMELADPDSVRLAYNKLHLENEMLQTELSDLREQISNEICIQGHALVATPQGTRGRGDMALGGTLRQRSESGSPITFRRTPSPTRSMPYMPPHERPLPRPERPEATRRSPSPEWTGAVRSTSPERPPQEEEQHQRQQQPKQQPQQQQELRLQAPPQPRRELPQAESRPVFGQLTTTARGQGFRRAKSDTQSRIPHDFDHDHDRMGNTLPASGPWPNSGASRRDHSSPRSSHQRPPPIQTNLEAEPTWRRKPASRTGTDANSLANLSFHKSGKANEPLAALVSHPGSMPSLGASGSMPVMPKAHEPPAATSAASLAHQMLAHAPDGSGRSIRRLAGTPQEDMSPVGSAASIAFPTPPGHGMLAPPSSTLAGTRASRSSTPPTQVGPTVRAPANLAAVMLEPLDGRSLQHSPGRLMTSPAVPQDGSSGHSRSSPNLLASTMPTEIGSGGGKLMRSMTAAGGQRQNPRQGRFGPADWDSAPVKPLPNDMCVMPLRSQEWMSGQK